MSNDKKAEQKTEPVVEAKEDAVAKAVGEALTKALPLAVAAAVGAQQQAAAIAAANKRGDYEKCSECMQVLRTPSGGGCQGKHVKMVVFPSNTRFAPFFPGVKINGVTYRSDHPAHQVLVPAQNDIPSMIQAFERSEEVLTQGRVAEHNSGTLGADGARTNPAYVPNWS